MPFSFRLHRQRRGRRAEVQNDPRSLLPLELWRKIFSFNSFSDIRSLTLVCHTFRLIGQPFLFETFTLHPYARPSGVRSQQHRRRMIQRLQFFQSTHIRPAVKECRLMALEDDKSLPSLRTMDDITDAVFDALPCFPNLATLVCRSVYFSRRCMTVLSALHVKVITLHSCFSDAHMSPDFSEVPFENITLKYPKRMGNSADPRFLSLFLRSRQLQRLFAGPTDEILHAMIMAQPLPTLSVLDIPVTCVASLHFIQALSACRTLNALSLHSLNRNEQLPILSAVPDDFLPSLVSYRGPNNYFPLLRNSSLRAIEISIMCETENLLKTLYELHGSTNLKSLSIRVSTVSSALLRSIHSSFPSLLTLIVKEPSLIPATCPSVFASSGTVPSLRSLTFPLFVSDPNSFWIPSAFEINDTLSFFANIYPQFLLTYPSLQRIQIVYNERGTSLLWMRRTSNAPPHPRDEDVRVEVDAFSSSSEGRTLYLNEMKRLQAIRHK